MVFKNKWIEDILTTERMWFSNDLTICSGVSLLFPLDKKCTYGIKCKFYHPERANQSYLSLADELREKAQISTIKEEKTSRLPPSSHLQSDHGPAPNAYPHNVKVDMEHMIDQQSSLHPRQVSENKILYWDGPRNTQNHLNFVPECQCQKKWPGPQSMSSHNYSSISHECLDSGLGSYESQYSDISHCLSSSHRPRHQTQSAVGSRYASVHSERNSTVQSCSCCSHVVPSTADQQHHSNSNLESKCQPKYETYPPHMFTPIMPHQHSLASHLQYSGAHHHQQKYWSDPFQMLPQNRSCSSLPKSVHSSHPCSHSCSYEGNQYSCWLQQQPSSAAFDPQRLELRKKLQAIFNPHQVDTVMEMFPHLTNAEKLAAEIFNLRI